MLSVQMLVMTAILKALLMNVSVLRCMRLKKVMVGTAAHARKPVAPRFTNAQRTNALLNITSKKTAKNLLIRYRGGNVKLACAAMKNSGNARSIIVLRNTAKRNIVPALPNSLARVQIRILARMAMTPCIIANALPTM